MNLLLLLCDYSTSIEKCSLNMSANIVDLTLITRNTCRGGFNFPPHYVTIRDLSIFFWIFGLPIILLFSLACLQRPAWGRRTENVEYKEAQHRSQRTAAQRRLFSSLSSAQRRGVVEQCANADLRDPTLVHTCYPLYRPLAALAPNIADTKVEGWGRSPLIES